MEIRGINDIYDEFIEVIVKLEQGDPRTSLAKQIDKEDFNENCFMVHVLVQKNEIKGMTLSYIPFGGGYEEIGTIEMGCKDWKKIKNYLNE